MKSIASQTESLRSRLPAGDLEVAQRLAFLRNTIGVSQELFASSVGITKASLAAYELGRVPLRFEIALRLCRHWIIGEEWLATGRSDGFFAAAKEKIQLRDTPSARRDLEPVVMRQCVDLLSEPIFHTVPAGLSYYSAFPRHFAPAYGKLVREHFFVPRISFLDDRPEPQLLERLSAVLMNRWLLLVANESRRTEDDSWREQRAFWVRVTKASIEAFNNSVANFHP